MYSFLFTFFFCLYVSTLSYDFSADFGLVEGERLYLYIHTDANN